MKQAYTLKAALLSAGLAFGASAATGAAMAAPVHSAGGNIAASGKEKAAKAGQSAHKAYAGKAKQQQPKAKARSFSYGGAQRRAITAEPVYYRLYAVQRPRPYESAIRQVARKYNLPEDLVHAVVNTESGYNARTLGGVGEIGLMQIRPATARLLGYTGPARGLYNPAVNLEYGTRYLALAHYLSGGSLCGTVLKYNAGHGATRMNPISFRYCQKVKAYLYAAGYRYR